MATNVGVWVRACTCMCKSVYVHACVFMTALAWVFVCVFGGCVVSACAFMFAVGVYVCECVRANCRACVKFVSNVTKFFLIDCRKKIMHYHNALFI